MNMKLLLVIAGTTLSALAGTVNAIESRPHVSNTSAKQTERAPAGRQPAGFRLGSYDCDWTLGTTTSIGPWSQSVSFDKSGASVSGTVSPKGLKGVGVSAGSAGEVCVTGSTPQVGANGGVLSAGGQVCTKPGTGGVSSFGLSASPGVGLPNASKSLDFGVNCTQSTSASGSNTKAGSTASKTSMNTTTPGGSKGSSGAAGGTAGGSKGSSGAAGGTAGGSKGSSGAAGGAAGGSKGSSGATGGTAGGSKGSSGAAGGAAGGSKGSSGAAGGAAGGSKGGSSGGDRGGKSGGDAKGGGGGGGDRGGKGGGGDRGGKR